MPDSYATAGAALLTAFRDGWADRTPVQYPGTAIKPPNDAAWVRITDRPDEAQKVTPGMEGSAVPVRYRHSGMLIIEILTPLGQGDGEARRLADAAAAIYRGAGTTAGIRYGAPMPMVVGVVDSVWWKMNVAVPYQWDADY